MPDLVVISGPPGAGKSAVAAALVEHYDPSALVCGDAFWGFLRRGAVDPWLPGTDPQNEAVAEAAGAAAGRLAQYCTVVFDGVIGPWFLPAFAAAAAAAPVLHYVVLLPAAQVCVERVRTRAGHGFTDLPGTRSMWSQFDRAEIDPRHVLRDPVGDAAQLAQRIAAAVRRGRYAV